MIRSAKIRELEKRIKSHTTQMMERRRKPKGTPQEEMEAAKRELEIVSNHTPHPVSYSLFYVLSKHIPIPWLILYCE